MGTRKRSTRLSIALLIPAFAYVGVTADLVAPNVGLIAQVLLAVGGVVLFGVIAVLFARGK